MREFNVREAKGDYSITFETDDRKAFEQVQTLCRILIDGKDGDVILVEWIKRYAKKGGRVVNILFPFEIEMMLEDWKNENE